MQQACFDGVMGGGFDVPQYSFARRGRALRGQWLGRLRAWLWTDFMAD